MYITSVISNFGAWETFQKDFPEEYHQFCEVVEAATSRRNIPSTNPRNVLGFSSVEAKNIEKDLNSGFAKLGWTIRDKIRLSAKKRSSTLKATKNNIGIEYGFGKFAYIESYIFVKIPLFIKSKRIRIGIILALTEGLKDKLQQGTESFELVTDRITEIEEVLPHYPFAIVGISDQLSPTTVRELTSTLDMYLIKVVGMTLYEMKIQTERPNYDFKVQLPAEQHKIAKEICALANHHLGGIILVGIDDSGNLVGIPRAEIDATQRRVIDIGTRNCVPSPKIDCFPFEVPSNPDKSILAIQVSEIERKPCMTKEKVYVRAGTMARAANSEEIRRLILGDAAGNIVRA